MQDYSQYGEQFAILEALGYDNTDPKPDEFDARLLWDIGAWQPKDKSNSRALIELGWNAVLFEPSPTPMLAQLAEYGFAKKVTLVQAPVTIEPGLIDLWVTDDAVSTANLTEYDRWKDATKFHGHMLVPAISLEHIANRFGGAEFVNLDAEGFSAELFLRMMDLGYRPKCICCEHDGRTSEILTTATREGYTATLVNSTNVVLVRR